MGNLDKDIKYIDYTISEFVILLTGVILLAFPSLRAEARGIVSGVVGLSFSMLFVSLGRHYIMKKLAVRKDMRISMPSKEITCESCGSDSIVSVTRYLDQRTSRHYYLCCFCHHETRGEYRVLPPITKIQEDFNDRRSSGNRSGDRAVDNGDIL